MKIYFSEFKSDYSRYIFPYVVWALPDPGDSPSLFFERGFLPNSRRENRYYMCRHVRIDLRKFAPSSENRRIMRKGEGITAELLAKEDFRFTPDWREFCKSYAERKFGEHIMDDDRLDSLMRSPIVSHVLVFRDVEQRQDVGLVLLYLESPVMAFYFYAFYELDTLKKNLGMYMMTRTVVLMQDMGIRFVYLGSCYSRRALYKTQFDGAEFFNGFCWSANLAELKYLIKRDSGEVSAHLLESGEYTELFFPDGFDKTRPVIPIS